KVPYLGFFDLESARKEKENLRRKGLDVTVGRAEAYSTLGWFRDPLTLNLITGSTADLVETILHEMTHSTLYVKGQSEFNEGLALFVGRVGTVLFFQEIYGPFHRLTREAEEGIRDERIFSSFLASLFHELEELYASPRSYEEKLAERERIFSCTLSSFDRIKEGLKTRRFRAFGSAGLNNAYLLAVGLYHRNFPLFERTYRRNGSSVQAMLKAFGEMGGKDRDILESLKHEGERVTSRRCISCGRRSDLVPFHDLRANGRAVEEHTPSRA
ncbi:MAG: aminopeptidase, partial [Deltaproteobacteria bacterium]|nr:aminopeptidase [Deltaproteobacteria bacterium]